MEDLCHCVVMCICPRDHYHICALRSTGNSTLTTQPRYLCIQHSLGTVCEQQVQLLSVKNIVQVGCNIGSLVMVVNNICSSGTVCKQHSSGTVCKQHSPGTVGKQHSPGTVCKQHSSGTVCKQHSSGTACKQHSPGKLCKQRSSGTACKQHSPGKLLNNVVQVQVVNNTCVLKSPICKLNSLEDVQLLNTWSSIHLCKNQWTYSLIDLTPFSFHLSTFSSN